MSRQKTLTKKVTRKKAKKDKPVGFYKEGGKTKPITKKKAKKQRVVKRVITKVAAPDEYVSKEAYKGGYGAHLTFEMEDEDGEVFTVDTDVRWETMKADKLVNTESRTPDGKVVNMKYLGPSKRAAWVDEDGDERVSADVQLGQLLPDGSWEPIDPFQMTKEIEAEPRSKEIMDSFLPDSFLEVWGDSTESQSQLRELARNLYLSGKVAAVRQFVKRKGTKAYVGFIKPVHDPEDEDVFGLEMMVSENRRTRRRWMPVDDIPVLDPAKQEKTGKKAKVPELF
ncbi:hypothetical protein H8E65_05510 [Candidatus Bathyarchaeota archaeon]|nr:hypothetical protein [Candidatus Bathyarchaeota archaeon]